MSGGLLLGQRRELTQQQPGPGTRTDLEHLSTGDLHVVTS